MNRIERLDLFVVELNKLGFAVERGDVTRCSKTAMTNLDQFLRGELPGPPKWLARFKRLVTMNHTIYEEGSHADSGSDS